MSMQLEIDIDNKVKKIVSHYWRNYSLLNAQVENLQKERDRFPLLFLSTHKEIKDYLTAEHENELKRIDELKLENEVLTKKLEQSKSLLKKISNKSDENSLLDIVKLEKNIEELKLVLEINSLNIKEHKNSFFYPEDNRIKNFHDDLLIYISNLHNKSLNLLELVNSSQISIGLDIESFSSEYIFEHADEYLKSKNFATPTETLRKSYLALKTDLKNLKKINLNMKTLSQKVENLMARFDKDEINQRRFNDKITNKLSIL